MESFFATLKKKRVYPRGRYRTQDETRAETFYNPQRRRSTLGQLSPSNACSRRRHDRRWRFSSALGNEGLGEGVRWRDRQRKLLLSLDPELYRLVQLGHVGSLCALLPLELIIVPIARAELGQPSRSVGKEACEGVDEFFGFRGGALVPDEVHGISSEVFFKELPRRLARRGERVQVDRAEGGQEIASDVHDVLRGVGNVEPMLPGRGSHVRRKRVFRMDRVDRHASGSIRIKGVPIVAIQ